MHPKYFAFFLAFFEAASAAPALTRKSTTTAVVKTTVTAGNPLAKTKTSTTTTAKTTTTTSKSTKKTTKTTTSPTTSKTTTSTTTTSPTSTPTSGAAKRGLSFNDPSLTSYFNSSKITWSYNWASDPYFGGSYTPNSYNKRLTYIPMLWSADSSLTSIWQANVANAQSTYAADSVLAFNEPDGCGGGGSCITPSTAAAAYKQWIQPLAGGSLKLGAPAVTNGVGAGLGTDWLTQFLGNCTTCTVDFIPMHWYGSVLDPGSFKTYVQSFYNQFGKPLWVTEFGASSGTDAQVVTFLNSVLPWLDTQSYVQRYAYFMDRAAGPPYLLNTDDSLTDIGTLYDS